MDSKADRLHFCVASEEHVFFHRVVNGKFVVGILNLKSGEERLLHCGTETEAVSETVLDAFKERALVLRSSQSSQALFALTADGKFTLLAENIGGGGSRIDRKAFASEMVFGGTDRSLRYLVHRLRDPSSSGHHLVVFLHGGPRSVTDAQYSYLFDRLLQEGFSVMAVNYIGSLGYENAERLIGKVGEVDLDNVRACINWERNQRSYATVSVFGGSHGGFLGAHLSCDPGFSCVCLRNPVISIDSMLYVTDIPDWCVVEGMGVPKLEGKLIEDWVIREGVDYSRERLHSISPISRVDSCCTPTLLGLGGRDLRVPASQGKMWYYALQARKITCQVMMYPEEEHGLTSATVSSTHWIEQQIDFLREHTVLK